MNQQHDLSHIPVRYQLKTYKALLITSIIHTSRYSYRHLLIPSMIYTSRYSYNIMAEGFHFMSWGLVRLRTFRLSAMGYLGATLKQVFRRTRSGRVTQRCHNSPKWETGLASANDVTYRKHAEDFGNLKKVRRVETRHRTRRVDFRLLVEALGGVARDGEQMKKPE